MKSKKVRPLLIVTPESPNFGDLCFSPRYKNKLLVFGHFENSYQDECKKTELILISLEDEKIGIGDDYVVIYPNGGTRKGTCKNGQDWNGYKTKNQENVYYKIIINQSQISPEYISKFIEQYNNGCVEDFEIVMDLFWNNGEK